MRKIFLFAAAAFCSVAMWAENEIYAVHNATDSVLTLYFDDQRAAREGVTDWSSFKQSTAKAILDESMKNALPTTTENWFREFKNLKSIEHLDYLNTSEVTNMSRMFSDCNKLTSFDISKFNTAKVTNMRSLFYGLYEVESLDVNHFNTSNVTMMRTMFCGCKKIKSLDLSNFNTAKVDTMYGMFEGCDSLVSLNVSNFNTGNVVTMERMFYLCKKLQSVDVSHFNTANVKTMWAMFAHCYELAAIDVSHFNTSNVENMGSLVESCKAITSLDIRFFSIEKLTKCSSMFSNCTALTTIYCATDWSAQTTITDAGNMFWGCNALRGGNGTPFSSDHRNLDYARPDEEGTPGYFTKNKPEGFESIEGTKSAGRKVIVNGQLLIIRDGKTFNALGVEVK